VWILAGLGQLSEEIRVKSWNSRNYIGVCQRMCTMSIFLAYLNFSPRIGRIFTATTVSVEITIIFCPLYYFPVTITIFPVTVTKLLIWLI